VKDWPAIKKTHDKAIHNQHANIGKLYMIQMGGRSNQNKNGGGQNGKGGGDD